MPPRITNVKWRCNGWLPEGILFDENTGTFTGTPHEVGEYTLPITVRTNYGEDTKDVMLVVEPPKYEVYAIGGNAATWADGGSPDDDGFYTLKIPRVDYLSEWDSGFRAIRNSSAYGCGTKSATISSSNGSKYSHWDTITVPQAVSGIRSICFTVGGTFSGDNTSAYVMATMNIGTITVQIKTYYGYSSMGISYAYSGSTKGVSSTSDIILSAERYSYDSIRWLTSDGTQLKTFTVTPSYHASTGTLTTENLAYKAKKITNRYGSLFSILSEDGYLNNVPNNFTHGIIKDAWGYLNSFYVQTVDNQLYEYEAGSVTWNLLGTYDIKKMEVTSATTSFMLTNNGKLYHKGNAITGLFTAHSNFTQVLPSVNFVDFTYSGSTLVFLKE